MYSKLFVSLPLDLKNLICQFTPLDLRHYTEETLNWQTLVDLHKRCATKDVRDVTERVNRMPEGHKGSDVHQVHKIQKVNEMHKPFNATHCNDDSMDVDSEEVCIGNPFFDNVYTVELFRDYHFYLSIVKVLHLKDADTFLWKNLCLIWKKLPRYLKGYDTQLKNGQKEQENDHDKCTDLQIIDERIIEQNYRDWPLILLNFLCEQEEYVQEIILNSPQLHDKLNISIITWRKLQKLYINEAIIENNEHSRGLEKLIKEHKTLKLLSICFNLEIAPSIINAIAENTSLKTLIINGFKCSLNHIFSKNNNLESVQLTSSVSRNFLHLNRNLLNSFSSNSMIKELVLQLHNFGPNLSQEMKNLAICPHLQSLTLDCQYVTEDLSDALYEILQNTSLSSLNISYLSASSFRNIANGISKSSSLTTLSLSSCCVEQSEFEFLCKIILESSIRDLTLHQVIRHDNFIFPIHLFFKLLSTESSLRSIDIYNYDFYERVPIERLDLQKQPITQKQLVSLMILDQEFPLDLLYEIIKQQQHLKNLVYEVGYLHKDTVPKINTLLELIYSHEVIWQMHTLELQMPKVKASQLLKKDHTIDKSNESDAILIKLIKSCKFLKEITFYISCLNKMAYDSLKDAVQNNAQSLYSLNTYCVNAGYDVLVEKFPSLALPNFEWTFNNGEFTLHRK